MSEDPTPTPPGSGGGGTPVGSATTECSPQCWSDDYEREISVNSCGRYHRNYQADGTEHNYTFNKTFKIIAPVHTGNTVTVEVRFKSAPQSGVNASDETTAKARLEAGVNTHWNGKFTLTAEDPDPECETKSFSVVYRVVWVTTGQDYTMRIHSSYPREGVSGNILNVSGSTSEWTYAHEFGHCVGLPDEYSYTTETETVRYIKPDGTLDVAVSAPPGGKATNAPDATIMAAVNNTTTLIRHGWNVAIEVQDLLRDELGRDIVCTIS